MSTPLSSQWQMKIPNPNRASPPPKTHLDLLVWLQCSGTTFFHYKSIFFSGGLGSYTPSKMTDAPFHLGVSRTVPPNSSAVKATATTNNGLGAQTKSEAEEVLRPTEDAISWSGSSSSSDMLF